MALCMTDLIIILTSFLQEEQRYYLLMCWNFFTIYIAKSSKLKTNTVECFSHSIPLWSLLSPTIWTSLSAKEASPMLLFAFPDKQEPLCLIHEPEHCLQNYYPTYPTLLLWRKETLTRGRKKMSNYSYLTTVILSLGTTYWYIEYVCVVACSISSLNSDRPMKATFVINQY